MFKKINILPKWMIFLVDLLVCYFSFIFSHYIKNDFSISGFDLHTNSGAILIWLFVLTINFFVFKTYSGIVRYTGLQDALKIFFAVLTAVAILFIISLFGTFMDSGIYFSAISLVIKFCSTIFFLIAYRLAVKIFFAYIRKRKSDQKNIVIYGGGEDGFSIKRIVENNYEGKVNIVAFIDEDFQKMGKVIDGVKIFHTRDFQLVIDSQQIDEVIIANSMLTNEKKNKIADFCMEQGVKVLYMKPFDQWINQQSSHIELKEVDLNSLLGDESSEKNSSHNKEWIKGSTILIAGAAGSIGTELAGILVQKGPKNIIICDHSETPLYLLYRKLQDLAGKETTITAFLGDVSNKERMLQLFTKFCPEYIFHLAGNKHGPLLEDAISEAILTNVNGTKILADLASEHSAKSFIYLSNERSFKPNNVLDMSKRLGELYILSLQKGAGKTRFMIARCGNVLGTKGSVTTIFKNQIKKGGPVTITHPDMKRSFITLTECCMLILDAFTDCKGGEIFLFEMGKPIEIQSLAQKMTRLYGLEPNKDIMIEYIGLRPGEKLYQELWDEEETIKTDKNGKIRKVKHILLMKANCKEPFEALIQLAKEGAANEILLAGMKELLPEFSLGAYA